MGHHGTTSAEGVADSKTHGTKKAAAINLFNFFHAQLFEIVFQNSLHLSSIRTTDHSITPELPY